MYYVKCIECDKKYSKEAVIYKCECNGLLDIIYDYSSIDIDKEKLKNGFNSIDYIYQ